MWNWSKSLYKMGNFSKMVHFTETRIIFDVRAPSISQFCVFLPIWRFATITKSNRRGVSIFQRPLCACNSSTIGRTNSSGHQSPYYAPFGTKKPTSSVARRASVAMCPSYRNVLRFTPLVTSTTKIHRASMWSRYVRYTPGDIHHKNPSGKYLD